MTNNKKATERRRELAERILDRTPYVRGNELRERVTDKMVKLLNEDDLAVLALATNLEEHATCLENKDYHDCDNWTAVGGCNKCGSFKRNGKYS